MQKPPSTPTPHDGRREPAVAGGAGHDPVLTEAGVAGPAVTLEQDLGARPTPLQRFRSWVAAELDFVRRTYGIGVPISVALIILPWALTFLFGGLMAFPPTRRLGVWMLEEDNLVEWWTFFMALAGCVFGLGTARWARRRLRAALPSRLYLLEALGLFVMAMEEISWTQRWTKFQTPTALDQINNQGEFTLHNIESIQVIQDYLFVAVCIAGILLTRTSRRSDPLVLRPPAVLVGLFSAILVSTALHRASFFVDMNDRFANILDGLVEVSELLIASAAMLHVFLNGRALRRLPDPAAAARPPT